MYSREEKKKTRKLTWKFEATVVMDFPEEEIRQEVSGEEAEKGMEKLLLEEIVIPYYGIVNVENKEFKIE